METQSISGRGHTARASTNVACRTTPGFWALLLSALLLVGCNGNGGSNDLHAGARGGGINGETVGPATLADASPELIQNGRNIFRYWTFGDEQQWTDELQMHTVIENAVDPMTALAVGLKVDMDALPPAVINGVLDGSIALDDPQTTLALIKLNAVVGIKGSVSSDDEGTLHLDRVGITCALCHSTVDHAGHAANANIPEGIGHRLDGWPNRDLNPGAIIALSPAVSNSQNVAVYNSWGPGKFDDRFNIDGRNDAPPVIPPAFGLNNVRSITFTGDGAELAYWNRYVGVTQMGGQGVFSDPRLPDPLQNSGAAIDRDLRGDGADCVASIELAAGSAAGGEDGTIITIPADNIITDGKADCVSNYLPALQAYQLSLEAPTLASLQDNPGLLDFAEAHRLPTFFEPTAAQRGEVLFNDVAGCAGCHIGTEFTDASNTLKTSDASVAVDNSFVERSASRMWRTSALPGLWTHPPYFHDGSADTLEEVVSRYNDTLELGLTPGDITDLAEYLKSL